MTRQALYQYLGTNGTILSPVHLEDIYYVKKYVLFAGPGKRLTKDYFTFVDTITVPEEDVNNWHEVDIEGQD